MTLSLIISDGGILMLSNDTFGESLLNALANILENLLSYIPQVFVGLLVLGLGLLLGKWVKSLIVRAVNSLNLDKLFATTSLSKFFQEAKVEVKIAAILGEMGRWIVIYIFLISAVNFVGLTFISEFLTNILQYIPNVISALFILGFGIIAAGFIEQLVKSAILPIDPSTARLAGKVSSYAVVIFALIIAIGELGIAESFINVLFIGFVGMFSLAIGLALGLGSKDLISKVLLDWYHKVNKEVDTPKAKQPSPKK